ncbi:MAG TPA: hypothetical protein VLV15_04260, partial [Dongiaceae bacterium]|nr:hypothetical protein [Dongiaceae bacterium]
MPLTDLGRPALRLPFRILGSAAVLVTALTLAGCVHPDKPQAPSPTTISGRVVYSDETSRGVPDALVRAVGKNAVATTDSTGRFTLTPSVT